jgi:methyltransferase (TIGR00027 family)
MAGVHPCGDEDSASLWLADMSVRFLAPSTGDLRAECQIPAESAQQLASRFFAGRKIFTTLHVDFSANGEHVARAEMKYFAQPSIQLRPSRSQATRSPIFNSKLKASARLIAGVRAQQSKHKKIRIDCPHTSIAASSHGKLLASRLQNELPQLTDLVHARTQHGDDTLASVSDLSQVVLLGAGLDMRPFRLFDDYPNIAWYELDLPVMLEERARVARQFPKRLRPERYQVAINLLEDDVRDKLAEQPRFSFEQPTVVIYEGCSMYFSESQNRKILKGLREVLKHPHSRLWLDFVDARVLKQQMDSPQVVAFLQSMEELGEKFIFGLADGSGFLSELGYQEVDSTTAGEYLESDDPICELYHFAVAR